MIIDRQLMFSEDQAITSASAASTYGVDTGLAARNLGVGDPLYLVISLSETMVGAAATITPTLRTSATATGTGSGTGGTIALTGSITTIATLPTFPALSVAGTFVVLALPPSDSYLEYLDVYYTLANTLSAGKFNAMIVSDTDLQHFYKAGYEIQ